ncbi:hypothetical protein ACIRO1_35195 [Streptomyces sp. NPDC102381]|uniref:hypothetical protein n=1 Tax=Streptomyces sp. NPDC102381 TaxID=3366164 RepID=UPI00380240E7
MQPAEWRLVQAQAMGMPAPPLTSDGMPGMRGDACLADASLWGARTSLGRSSSRVTGETLAVVVAADAEIRDKILSKTPVFL